MKRLILILLFVSAYLLAQPAKLISIIPKPVVADFQGAKFKITQNTKVSISARDAELQRLGVFLLEAINGITGWKLKVELQEGPGENKILLSYDVSITRDEEYKIAITPTGIAISSGSTKGIFYGIQTLLQLMPVEAEGDIEVPCGVVIDYPRFKWRGVHLDVGRHFFPVEFIKKYLDIISTYKINTFHWHLTDDQGWRIEIKKYPQLTSKGAWRKETMGDGKPHGGFYTQEEIKEIVEHGRKKFITIVPEIEMPGHAVAALSAYPEFSCTGGPFEVATRWGIYEDVFCAGKDGTFEFLEGILSEVIELFPGEYIHIGGDEVPKSRWENCDKCQARIKSENLKNEHELQSYFIRRIEKFVNSKGRKIIGWDEILEGGLAPNAAVMSWRGIEGGIATARMKHYAVMSPGSHCYFDHYQGLYDEPKAIGGYTPLSKVYSYEPVPEVLNAEEAKYIMGAQANMWSEYYETTDHVEYMLLPRLCALAEVVWSPKAQKNFDDFSARLEYHYERFISDKINFRIPTPFETGGEYLLTDNETFSFNLPVRGAKAYYTIDGSEPNENSIPYSGPIQITEPVSLKAKTYLPNGKSSPTAFIDISFIDTTENGLFFKYYEGEWDSIPQFWEMRPEKRGKVHKISLQDIEPREDNFGVDFFGFIKIEEDGLYTFYLTSDDGSRLFINNNLIIDNDGLHATREVKASVYLESGIHPFKIFYFERGGEENLKVEIEGTGISRRPIPASFLFFSN